MKGIRSVGFVGCSAELSTTAEKPLLRGGIVVEVIAKIYCRHCYRYASRISSESMIEGVLSLASAALSITPEETGRLGRA